MNTTENNKVIDTFMESKGEYISYKDQWGGEYWGEYIPNKYHSDWNLLIEVVEKIESLDRVSVVFEVENLIIITIATHNIGEKFKCKQISKQSKSKIESVYNAVVEFIKWYNEQNK